MPNLDQLVQTAADYKLMVDVPLPAGGFAAFVLKTADAMSYDVQVEDETINAIGTVYPIAEKSNGKTYRGSLGIQMGELNAILLSCGYNDATQLQGCTLALTAIQGGFARIFKEVNFNTERLSIRAKDKQTIATMEWKAVGVNVA